MILFNSLVRVVSLALFLALAGPALAADNLGSLVKVEETNSQEVLRSYLQLQEQVHATQLALEQNRKEAQDAAVRNAEELGARLRSIETALAAQRARELEAMQSSNRVMLTVAGTFAAIGFLAMLLMAYFQWRTVSGLAQISSTLPSMRALELAPGLGAADGHLLAAGPAALSSQRLLGTLEALEKRLLQLEHTTATPVLVATPASGAGTGAERPADQPAGESSGNGAGGGSSPEVPRLLSQGESLLNQEKADEALAKFDAALALEPSHPEALVKKGIALERMQRFDEAIGCYDRAIAAKKSLTVAYLHKGGLFNRMEKFNEALECYEQALRTHEETGV